MEGYVVRYHPEGWRSAKDELPEESGIYFVAGEIISWNGEKRKEMGLMEYDAERKACVYLFCGEGTSTRITHWHSVPTPPWEIMPKENNNA